MRSSIHSAADLLADPTAFDDEDIQPAEAPPPVEYGLLAGSTTTGSTVPTVALAASGGASVTVAAQIATATNDVLAAKGQTIALSTLFSVSASSADPAYLILSGLDRVEYTAGYKTSAMGHLADGSTTQNFSNFNGDGWSVSMVFTYQASTGQYVNATYGSLSQVMFDTGSNLGDTATFTLFGASNAAAVASYAANPLIMSSNPAYFTDYGSVAVVTGAAAATAPASATPDSIVSAALSFVGDAWNSDGCWVLASDISAKAGATLPLTSSMVGVAGVSNGEWFVAYNGPVSASSSWINTLVAGEMVSFVTTSGGGHITTVVSGTGSNAELVDNITYVGANGSITDAADDGSANDVIVQAPHAASAEFSGVNAATVVVYELDCPVVTATSANVSVLEAGSVALSGDFSAANPKSGQSVTEYQAYESNAADTLTASGVAEKTAISAAAACTLTSLSGLTLTAGSTAGSDTIEVRAYNGSYWGDWTALTVTVTAPPPLTAAAAVATTGTSVLKVADTAANISAEANALQTLAAAGRLASVTITGSGLVALSVAQLTSDHTLLALLPASGVLSVASATVAQAAALQSNAQVAAYAITDTAANVSSALSSLLPLATGGKLSGITLSNPTTALTLSVAQVTSDAAVLSRISGSYLLALTGASVATSASLAAVSHVASVSITDTAANITAGLAGLETLAAAGKLGAIILSNTTTPTLTLTSAQVTTNSAVLADITSAVKLSITGTGGADTLTLTGISAPVAINLDGNTATASGGLSASTMRFITPPDVITLGSGAATITAGLTGSSGIETVANFQFGLDQLQLSLGSLTAVSAFNTTYDGAHAIALTGGGLTEGVVLINQPATVTAASVLSSHVHISGGVATIS